MRHAEWYSHDLVCGGRTHCHDTHGLGSVGLIVLACTLSLQNGGRRSCFTGDSSVVLGLGSPGLGSVGLGSVGLRKYLATAWGQASLIHRGQ